VRPYLFAAFVLVAGSAAGQTTSGVYQPSSGPASAWSISPTHTLLWDGAPYIPEGLRIGGTVADVVAAKKAGFQDLVVDLPPSGTGWKEVIDALEANGMRYLISVDSLIPSAKGIAVEPEAYRVSGINTDQHVEFALPGATSAMVMLVTERDATLQSSERVPVAGGRFKYDVKAPNGLDHVLLIYPEQAEASHPDYWEGFDLQRDLLLTALQHNKPGKGLRGILNPMGRLFSSVSTVGRFVPESAYFRMEFRAYLESKYRNIETAMRAWAMNANDVDSFDGLSRLVPMWSGSRGIGDLWDPTNDRMYTCEQRRSMIWTDIATVMSTAAAKRFERLVPAIQRVANVPVLQEWTGWTEPFESSRPLLNGIGYRATGATSLDLINAAARPVSSLLRWKSPGWLLCTDLNVDKLSDASATLSSALDDMESMGTRGFFLRSSNAAVLAASAADAIKRATDLSSAQASTEPAFFPENAWNPAVPMRLPAGRWWLPSPADGNRVDFGAGFHAYRYSDGSAFYTALWTTAGAGRVRLRMTKPESANFTTTDGSDPKLKRSKNGVELIMSQSPVIVSGTDELPVPEPAYLETSDKFSQLLKAGETAHRDIAQDAYLYGTELASFQRDPGGSFLDMRKQFWILNRKLSRFLWLEAENTKDTNFSEIMPASGCSNGSVLALHTPITTDARGFYAEYTIPVKTESEQEVWIAARIPEDARRSISMDIAGQRLNADSPPESPYSSGYAWYKIGTTKLNGRSAKLSLQVNSPEGADLAIDAILLFPGHFQPNGITMPDSIPFTTGPATTKGRKK
jgi:hypothetical protein